MKTLISIALVLFGLTTFAQEQKVTYEKAGDDLVKATYYFADNNNVIERIGYFNKDKQLQGTWTSFNKAGEKTVVAHYENGLKHGEWFYYGENKIKIVTYEYNKIKSVKDTEVAIN